MPALSVAGPSAVRFRSAAGLKRRVCMNTLKATINYSDEILKVLLQPALDDSMGERAQEKIEPETINLIKLVDDRMFEPALFHCPYVVLPSPDEYEHYINFMQALRHTDQFALAEICGLPQKPMGLLYPSKNFLMLVLIRSNDKLVEPDTPDWVADAATITAMDIAELRSKLENLSYIPRARSADSSQ
jgi:non-homologous end joining protein Ku